MASTDLIHELKEKIKEQDEFLQRITTAATEFVSILDNDGDFQIVSTAGGQFRRVMRSSGKIGEAALIVTETGQIVEVSTKEFGFNLATVLSVRGDYLEIEVGGEAKRLVRKGHQIKEVKTGDVVLLDFTKNIALRVTESPKPELPTFIKVAWNEVAGCSEAKLELQDMISNIHGTNQWLEEYGVKPARGFLLWGPPGNGKTLLGRAVATALKGGFVYISATEILNMYVGVSEERIRNLFNQARIYHKQTGIPSIIFIDEADAILGRRGNRTSSNMETTLVPTFLTEMDGLSESKAIVILATNRPDTLDEAVIRDGRIDRKIHIGFPTPQDQREILTLGLRGVKMRDSLDDCLNAALKILDSKEPSGALLANIANISRQLAARRDYGQKKITGITVEDLVVAVHKGL